MEAPAVLNRTWALDFMEDSLYGGRRFRVLNVIDEGIRGDVLDAYVFGSIAEVRVVTKEWLEDYNRERPHDSLGGVPPLTFLPRHEPAGSTHSAGLLDG